MDNYAEQQFCARVQKRADELGLNVRHVYVRSGMSRDLTRAPISRRTIETVETLAENLGWTLSQILGFSDRIDIEISTLAYDGAGVMVSRMPATARTKAHWVGAHAILYDLLVARLAGGRLPDDIVERTRILEEYVEILVRAWETQPKPAGNPPVSVASGTRVSIAPNGASTTEG